MWTDADVAVSTVRSPLGVKSTPILQTPSLDQARVDVHDSYHWYIRIMYVECLDKQAWVEGAKLKLPKAYFVFRATIQV